MGYAINQLLKTLASGKFVILDTETTGLKDDAEIVQLGIIEPDGTELVNCIVRPQLVKPDERNHIVTKYNDFDMATGAQWHIRDKRIAGAIGDRTIITYNADFDRRMLIQTARHDKRSAVAWEKWDYVCAMVAYAEHHGEWNDWAGSYKWKPLSHAAHAAGVKEAAAHTAIGDCLTTLGVCRWLQKVAKFDTGENQA